jgi:hypothetical protein
MMLVDKRCQTGAIGATNRKFPEILTEQCSAVTPADEFIGSRACANLLRERPVNPLKSNGGPVHARYILAQQFLA